MSKTYKMLIDGNLVIGNQQLGVINPATGQTICDAPDCSRELLDQAVAAARKAFPAWKATPLARRGALLKQAAEVLMTNIEELLRLLTSEQGKSHDEARFEVNVAAAWLTSFAEMTLPVTVNEDTDERRSETRHVPLGVVGAIAPWNFPLITASWKMAPALMAGNTLVLKPSPFTPLATLRFGELLREVFPAGVLNIVSGGDDLGPWMTSHPGIDKISFTGSTATGKRVMQSASTNLKRITLELGGTDAAIVLPDVDVKSIAPQLFWAAFRNTGQICVCTKRLYVHADIYDELARALADYTATVIVGDGAQPGTQLGPLQNKRQYDRVVDLIRDAQARESRFLTGGKVESGDGGYFIPVTIVDNPPEDSRVVQEEAFGPVLPMLKFNDLEEVIARANNSEFGLAGSVWSANTELALSVAARLQTGTVWINEVLHLTPFAAFAGHKQSGVGVENGLAGFLEYTVPQTITVKKLAMAS